MRLTTNPSIRQIRIAYLATAFGGLLFSFDLPLLRLSLADPWTMVFARGVFLFLAISAAWILASNRGESSPFIAGKPGLIVALTSMIGNIAYILAIVQTSAANVVFIIALTPVIAAVMSRAILRERVHAFTWVATVLAFTGVGIIAWDGILTAQPWGSVLALISAFCSATAFTVVRATGREAGRHLAAGGADNGEGRGRTKRRDQRQNASPRLGCQNAVPGDDTDSGKGQYGGHPGECVDALSQNGP